MDSLSTVFCPHCGALVSRKTYRMHKRLYYDSDTEQWIKRKALDSGDSSKSMYSRHIAVVTIFYNYVSQAIFQLMIWISRQMKYQLKTQLSQFAILLLWLISTVMSPLLNMSKMVNTLYILHQLLAASLTHV